MDAQAEKSIEIPFFVLLTIHLEFLLFLFAVIRLTFTMQRRMSISLLVSPMTFDEEAEFGDDGDNEGASKGKSAAVALKPQLVQLLVPLPLL